MRQDDGRLAGRALRRLAGDALEPDEARALDLRPAETDEPLDAADCFHTLAVLAQLCRKGGRPLVLCFDQINNLSRPQISEISHLLHELNDRVRNTLLILSEVQDELLRLKADRVITPATWDRLTARQVTLPRLTVAEGRTIMEARLATYLKPFADLPAVRRRLDRDPLFPLGETWFQKRFGELIDVRPRRLISSTRERWQDLQRSLDDAPDKAAWLDGLPPGEAPPPPPPRSAEELVDDCVAKAVADRLARFEAEPQSLPPSADNLRGVTESLAAALVPLPDVEQPGRNAAFHLTLSWPAAEGRSPRTLGMLVVDSGAAKSVTAALGRVRNAWQPSERVLLVTDVRRPLALGKSATAQGRRFYNELKALPGFEHLKLTVGDYAELVALDAVAREASDMEVAVEGRTRPLRQQDVFASYRRQNRLGGHRLFVRIVPARHRPIAGLTFNGSQTDGRGDRASDGPRTERTAAVGADLSAGRLKERGERVIKRSDATTPRARSSTG